MLKPLKKFPLALFFLSLGLGNAALGEKRVVYIACVDCYSSASLYPIVAEELFPDVELRWVLIRTQKQYFPGFESSINSVSKYWKKPVLYLDPDSEDGLENLVNELKRLNVVRVIGGMDKGAYHSARISALLRKYSPSAIDNDPATASLRKNKGPMAWSAGRYGIPTKLTAQTSEVLAFAEELRGKGYREMIIKPDQSGGGDEVRFVSTKYPKQMMAIFNSLLNKPDMFGHLMNQLIIQPAIEGVEYYANTFTYNGVTKITGLWRYYKIRIPGGRKVYFIDRPMELSSSEAIALGPVLSSICKNLGHDVGPAHIEMIQEGRTGDWRLIEINSRIAGAGIPMMDREIWGISHLDLNLLMTLDLAKFEQEFANFPRPKMQDGAIHAVSSPLHGKLNEDAYVKLSQLKTFRLPAEHYRQRGSKNIEPTVDLQSIGLVLYFVGETEEVKKDLETAIQAVERGGLIKYDVFSWIPLSPCMETLARIRHKRVIRKLLPNIQW